ncbi:MAG: hypothetical protein ACK55Z_11805, partial [bacterium]
VVLAAAAAARASAAARAAAAARSSIALRASEAACSISRSEAFCEASRFSAVSLMWAMLCRVVSIVRTSVPAVSPTPSSVSSSCSRSRMAVSSVQPNSSSNPG